MRNIKDIKDIKDIALNYKIIVDITSVTHKSAKRFFLGEFSQILNQNHAKIIIPKKLKQNLEDNALSENDTLVAKSEKGLLILEKLIRHDIAYIVGSDDDPELQELFKKLVIDFSNKHDICLITQNRNLVNEMIRLRQDLAEDPSKDFVAFRISCKNSIEQLFYKEYSERIYLFENTNSKTFKVDEEIVKFKIYKSPVSYSTMHYLNVRAIPCLNDSIYVMDESGNKVTHTLVKEIGNGGEGDVYLTDKGMACKIYKKNKLTNLKKSKIEKMITNPVSEKGIAWAKYIAYNQSGEFVGYVMERAVGRELQKTVFVKPLLKKYFPNWNRRTLVTLCINILEKIKYLHDRNVIIGDLNPLNILVKDYDDVWFVDTDSYQIENYPCPVGTVNYTPPELQGKDYKKVLRTFDHEYFAVATLVFMILMPGKPPYSRKGGSDPATNIKGTEFSYPYGRDRSKNTPQGAWKFIWSHFPRYIKNFMFDVFQHDQRKTTDEWIKILKRYEKDLITKDNLSDEIFPQNFKPRSNSGKKKVNIQPQTAELISVNNKKAKSTSKTKTKTTKRHNTISKVNGEGKSALKMSTAKPSKSTRKKTKSTTNKENNDNKSAVERILKILGIIK